MKLIIIFFTTIIITFSTYAFFMDNWMQMPGQMMQQVIPAQTPSKCECVCAKY